MNETRLDTVAQLRAFLNGTVEVQFQPGSDDVQRYDFIATVLRRFAYRRLGGAKWGQTTDFWRCRPDEKPWSVPYCS